MINQFKVYMDKSAPERVSKVLESGYIGQGSVVDEFEVALRDHIPFSHGLTVNSATSALWLACHLIGIGPGDHVISTPMTCSATNEVLALRGAHIVWADVDEYGNIHPFDVAVKLNNNIKAIVAVDWGGLPCDYRYLRVLADKSNVPIIQDAAHSFGAQFQWDKDHKKRFVGDYIAYSFQAIKHVTTGDGGLLVVPKEQYERAKLLRWYGLDRTTEDAMRCRQDIKEAGYKFHMNDINAALGLANLNGIEQRLIRAREMRREYDTVFRNAKSNIVPEWPDDRSSSNWLYTIHVNNPRQFEYFMNSRGIGASQVHSRNDWYTAFAPFKAPLPKLDEWFSTMCAIPIGWWISRKQQQYIIKNVLEYVNGD